MNRLLTYLIFLIVASAAVGCGGTHGSIKNYHFDMKKSFLETKIIEVVNTNSNLSFEENDRGNSYFEISISGQPFYSFVCRYYGNEELWNASNESEIFIAYIKIDRSKYLTDDKISNAQKKKAIANFEEHIYKNIK